VPLVIVVALIPIAIGVWWYLDHAAANRQPPEPPGLTAEAKAYVGNLKLSGVDMKATENYAGAAVVEITGQITNAGNRTLERADLTCVFYDVSGLVVFRERVPIVKTTMKPGETKPFRMAFEGIPTSWNQAMPQLVIAHVSFAQ
jgi:hypothetical protein